MDYELRNFCIAIACIILVLLALLSIFLTRNNKS